MELVLLGSASGAPTAELLLSPQAERLPLPLGVDDSYAFDKGLPRLGWVAVKVGYQVVALADGDLLQTTRLALAWTIAPAADPRLLLVRRFRERDEDDNDPAEQIDLVDAGGRTLRSVTAPFWGVVGELTSGEVVGYDPIVSWDGVRRDLPARGRSAALIGGRWLLMADHADDVLRFFDTETCEESTSPLRGSRTLLGPNYDALGQSVAFGYLGSSVLAATPRAGPIWLDFDFDVSAVAWLNPRRLLVTRERKGPAVVVDVDTGEQTIVETLPPRARPRIDVTARFDPEQLRRRLQPPWTGAVPAGMRQELIEQSRERIRAAADASGLNVQPLDLAVPAIRIRSCLPPKRFPIGGSRLGGRPDMPQGRKWPRFGERPMAFLAQLRVDELRASLPDDARLGSGDLLLFFAVIEPDGGYPPAPDGVHVEVVDDGRLRRLPWPNDLDEELRYTPSLAVAEPTLSVPDRFGEDQQDDDEARAGDDFADLVRPDGPAHQLFGYPMTIQDVEPPDGCELLLQVDGDPLTGAAFGDGGRLHIWKPTDAALTRIVVDCTVELDSM